MSSARFIVGDASTVMADMLPASVDLVITSPPFLALRSYLSADHPDKALEMGSEATPGEFIDALLDVTEAAARLLTPHGSIAVELGDTYAGSGGDYNADGLRDGQQRFKGSASRARYGDPKVKGRAKTGGWGGDPTPVGWPMAKSLCLIPELYRLALVYGFNPLTGRTTPQWRARNVIRWVRANPPVGFLGDKFRPATSEMVVACKSAKRWFDLDAVRTPLTDQAGAERCGSCGRKGRGGGGGGYDLADLRNGVVQAGDTKHGERDGLGSNLAGAPPLDWWLINPTGYPGAHYATFPAELCVRPIQAMCPRRVCRVCGAPSRRLTAQETPRVLRGAGSNKTRIQGRHTGGDYAAGGANYDAATYTTTGWSTCACDGADGIRLDGYHTGTAWRPGLVLDPFCGTGTGLSVATGHGRDAIGIDLDPRSLDFVRERVGMFLDETTEQQQ